MKINGISMKIKGGLLGLGALLMTSMVNAATVSLTPSTQTVANGASFTLDITGNGFTQLVSGGSVNLTWDTNLFSMDTTFLGLNGSLPADFGFVTNGDPIDVNADTIIQPGVLAFDPLNGHLEFTAVINFFDPFAQPIGPDFTFASLAFTALATGDVTIAQGFGGSWQDATGLDYTADPVAGNGNVVTYNNAMITVTPNAVPIPAAAWLFASGLLGMIGVARRRLA